MAPLRQWVMDLAERAKTLTEMARKDCWFQIQSAVAREVVEVRRGRCSAVEAEPVGPAAAASVEAVAASATPLAVAAAEQPVAGQGTLVADGGIRPGELPAVPVAGKG